MMTREEFFNICLAEGLSKREVEYGWEQMPPDLDLPSTPESREMLIELLKKWMPDFIRARNEEG